MNCLEVALNGNVICTAGNEQGSVNIHIMQDSWPNLTQAEISLHEITCRPPGTGDDLAPKLRAALQHPERPASTRSVFWIDRKRLKTGDEITIRLIDVPVNA